MRARPATEVRCAYMARGATLRTQTRWRALPISVLAAAVALGAFSLGGASGGSGSRATHRGRPNVVVVLTDDQDTRSISVMGNVKRLLARRGVTFENSFVTYSLCCPSRVTLLTGQYAHNHGVVANNPPHGG